MWSDSFDLYSPSGIAAIVLKPSWVVLSYEEIWGGLTIRSTSGRLLTVSFHDSPLVLLGAGAEVHRPVHGECGGHCPQTRKSRLTVLSESGLHGLRYPMSHTEVLLISVMT